MSGSTFQDMLYELKGPLETQYALPSALFDAIKREDDERKRKDDAYLAALSARELRIELTRRRIADVERRYRYWWEEHMAWRFLPRRPDGDHDW